MATDLVEITDIPTAEVKTLEDLFLEIAPIDGFFDLVARLENGDQLMRFIDNSVSPEAVDKAAYLEAAKKSAATVRRIASTYLPPGKRARVYFEATATEDTKNSPFAQSLNAKIKPGLVIVRTQPEVLEAPASLLRRAAPYAAGAAVVAAVALVTKKAKVW